MLSEDDIQQTVRCLKGLAHPTRLEILCLLRDGEMTVHELQTHFHCTQSNISQHLSLMRNRGLLTSRKDANEVFYGAKHQDMYRRLETLCGVSCQYATHETPLESRF